MDAVLTLCSKNIQGDIPTYKFKNLVLSKHLNEAQELFYYWLEQIDLNEGVLVCFETINGLSNEKLRDKYRSILISHDIDEIQEFGEKKLNADANYEVDFAVFEFEDYQEAFSYCKDLKEGF